MGIKVASTPPRTTTQVVVDWFETGTGDGCPGDGGRKTIEATMSDRRPQGLLPVLAGGELGRREAGVLGARLCSEDVDEEVEMFCFDDRCDSQPTEIEELIDAPPNAMSKTHVERLDDGLDQLAKNKTEEKKNFLTTSTIRNERHNYTPRRSAPRQNWAGREMDNGNGKQKRGLLSLD
jgi:hypothetical protein